MSQVTHVRSRSFDGLRGLAAFIVMIHHAILTFSTSWPASGWLAPVVHFLQENILFLGRHSVWLFFILSGMVLARMYESAKFKYRHYLVSRTFRIYVPVIAAVAFTWLTMQLVPRSQRGLGWWMDFHPAHYGVNNIIRDITILNGCSGNLSPLWSLKWEMWFSIFLGLYVWAARRFNGWFLAVTAWLLSTAGAYFHIHTMQYLPIFMLGVVLHVHWNSVTAWFENWKSVRVSAGKRGYQYLFALSLALIFVSNGPWRLSMTKPAEIGFDVFTSLLGLMLLIVLAELWEPENRFFTSKPLQFLGLISFSLYLVHEPIILGFVYAFGQKGIPVFVALIVSIPAARLFHRFVDQPTHEFARRLR